MNLIMVAMNGSEGADRALDMAAEMARKEEVRLVVVTMAMDEGDLRGGDIDLLRARKEG